MASEEIELQLIPAPGSSPEFLATVAPMENDPQNHGVLPFEIVLDTYTRESWSTLNSNLNQRSIPWRIIYLKTNDARSSKKIHGFMKYLNERKKSVSGNCVLLSKSDDDVDNDDPSNKAKGLFVIPFDQEIKSDVEYISFRCKVLADASILKKMSAPAKRKIIPTSNPQPSKKKVTQKSSKYQPIKSSGLMGKLLGASSRTGIALATVPKISKQSQSSNANNNNSKAEILNKFREHVEEILKIFHSNFSLSVCKVHVSIGSVLRRCNVDKMNAPPGLSMEILKYVVYESVDEIGQDKWIAYKEPSEFTDECNIAVYKEGKAPPEVLEEINKGELPEEVKAAQRAIRATAEREVARREGKKDAEALGNAVESLANEDLSTLNTIKRDRRTIEEIQKELDNRRQQME